MTVHINAVTQTPYIIDDNGILKSETCLSISSENRVPDAWVKICVEGKAPYIEPIGCLEKGSHIKTVHVAELDHEGDCVTFKVYDAMSCTGDPLALVSIPQKKVRHWTVYVSHGTHVDIGYTDFQEYLRNVKWPGHIDDAMKFMDETDDWKDEDKFRHHIESSYLLYGSAFNVRNADWLEEFKAKLQSGRLAYSASCMNTSMEIMGTEQLVRYYYYSQRLLKDMLGIESSSLAMMVDNPSISWANIDIMADAGVKYMYLGPNFNSQTPKTVTDVYPRVFFMAGRKPYNKITLISGNLYNLDEMQFVPDGPKNTPVSLPITVKCTGDVLMNIYHKDNYPFDAVLQCVDQFWDNGPLLRQVMERVREMNARTDAQGRKYIYPRFLNSNMKDFCNYIGEKFSSRIRTYTGTFENWWCFGAPSDAYSATEIRYAHDLLPAAETFAAIANHAAMNAQYPYGKIADAYNLMMLYDEHTFGPSMPAVGDQHIWKRNTAISSKRIADDLIGKSLSALNSLIPAEGKTIVVYNPLSWGRSDIVRFELSGLPAHFDLVDMVTLEKVKYQKFNDGQAEFFAADVPGLGYKCFKVCERPDEPVFKSSISKTWNTIENNFFKVTIGSQGEIVSILDKQNGNIELADNSCPYKMNEFVYFTSDVHQFKVHSVSRVNHASIEIGKGAVQGTIVSEGFCEGTAGIKRSIVLYDSIPRIDFVNVVYKSDAVAWRKQDEEGYFVFPLNVPDFTLRHEMPAGDVRPYVDPAHAEPECENSDIEQFYTSSTDFYAVNRWIDASSRTQDYGITLSTLSAPIVQYGERRSILYDVGYNTRRPWIYSYALNNKWATNFMDTQPGVLTFRYSLKTHSGDNWRGGRADRFGWETSVPLIPKMIDGAQPGSGYGSDQGQWIHIEPDNVVMTVAKIAEANSEGMILRFNETLGKDTAATVNLSFFEPFGVTETDLMENDKSPLPLNNGKVTFQIDGYGWKTIRVRFGATPCQVSGVTATMDTEGTRLSWNSANDGKLAFYEAFRDTHHDFSPGTGNYLGSTSEAWLYDRQVVEGLTRDYFYKVRAVRGGLKGMPSEAARAEKGIIVDCESPAAPADLRADFSFGNRVSLSWLPSADNLYLRGYRIFRDEAQIADLAPIHNSYLDVGVLPGRTYNYYIMAYDDAGNLSKESNTVSVTTAKGSIKPGNIALFAKLLASSQLNDDFPVTAVTDGFAGVTGEWASSGERNPWLRLEWPEAHSINRIVLYDRDTDECHANKGTLYFSDGSSVEVDGIPDNGSAKTVMFADRMAIWVNFKVTGGRGLNVGLAEIEVYETVKGNIAPEAKVTCSSALSRDYSAEKAVDNIIGVHGHGEWISAGEQNPWIQLAWAESRNISQIVLYDRVSKDDNVNAGLLSFSDGSTLSVNGIPGDGTPFTVTFPDKTVDWVKFQVTEGTGSQIGLSEIQVI